MSDMDLQKTDQQKQKELKKMEKQKAKEEKKQQKVQKKEQKKASMEPGRKKKIIKRSIFGGVAAVFVLFIIYNNIAAANAKPVVYTMAVAKGDIEQTVNTSGSVVSDEVKTYFAPVSIEVGTIHVAVGESASKGQAVLTYDETDFANEKRTAELKLQQNEGSYKNSIQKNN